MPVAVHPRREQCMDVDHAAALTDLQHQRIRRDEGIRAGVQRPGPEVLDDRVEIGSHDTDLRLAQPRDAQGLDQLLHPPGTDTEQVASRHHTGQSCLRPPPALQQPVREIGPGPEPGNGDVQGADPGVEVPVPVTITDVDPARAGNPIRGTADRVGLRRHQGVQERGQQRPEQIRRRGRHLVVQHAGRINTGLCGHRVVLHRVDLVGLSKDHAVAALSAYATPINGPVGTPLCWTQLRYRSADIA